METDADFILLYGCVDLDCDGILEEAAAAADQGRPYAFARLSHHELGVIKGPEFFDVNIVTGHWPADWKPDAEAVIKMRDLYPAAFAEMDCIGLLHGLEDRFYVDEAIALLAETKKQLQCIGPRFCRSLEQHLPALSKLLEGRRWLALGMGADKWAPAVQRLAGGIPITWPWSNDAAMNDWVKYEQVLQWCEAWDATTALIALGPWAVILAADLRRAGMVALDFGAGLPALDAA